jgi:triacylglycerol lipase
MALVLIEDAFGDPRNAAALARAADIAYLPEAEGKPRFSSELGLDARLISADNTQAYIAGNADHIVVAFRGTEDPTSIDGLKDCLLTDAMNLLMVPEGRLGTDLIAAGVGARFHQGFVNAIGEIWDPVFEAVNAEVKKEDRPVWITGHSLGGALAKYAAWLFTRKYVNIHQIYTFGAPMIGNAAACQAFDENFPNKLFRYVNSPDPVPMLPTMSMLANQFQHCQKEMRLGESGDSLFAGVASKSVDGVLNMNLIDELWSLVKARVGAHSMTSYLDLLK